MQNVFAIILRYSFTLRTLGEYFLVLGNLIFLHFRTISNKLMKLPCAYLNTQGSGPFENPLKRIGGG
ncbi:hypothetical protein T03_7832 [Trichinella britovi]|uniref:Uncharacterized protein n=1 Tax=Trichinella britovi TaxID=45882 RepID=A0A0V1DBX1_TRIBR|nr:hypothetical protein T03_7832 [Trichinella britovi]